jgi:hypothetical protein
LFLLNSICVAGTAYWQHRCFLRTFHIEHVIFKAMKNNCTCLWVNRRKHPTATVWFCSARMSRRQREKTGKTQRLALLWWRDNRKQRKRHPKPAKTSGENVNLCHILIFNLTSFSSMWIDSQIFLKMCHFHVFLKRRAQSGNVMRISWPQFCQSLSESFYMFGRIQFWILVHRATIFAQIIRGLPTMLLALLFDPEDENMFSETSGSVRNYTTL